MDQPFLTAKDVCKRLKCAMSTLYRWQELGLFPRPLHMGSMVRWKESDLEDFIKYADLQREARGPRPAGIRRGRPSGCNVKPAAAQRIVAFRKVKKLSDQRRKTPPGGLRQFRNLGQ
jgi:predicted DNA-binding transcriptional regulator AlpA